jgi:hypothetical protein
LLQNLRQLKFAQAPVPVGISADIPPGVFLFGLFAVVVKILTAKVALARHADVSEKLTRAPLKCRHRYFIITGNAFVFFFL